MKKKKQSKENKGKAKGKKKGKNKDKQKPSKDDEITEKEIPEQIGIFNDFLVFGKNNKKEDNNIQDNNNFHLQRLESEFASFLIIKNEPNQKESRFSSLFKELVENDKKEKQKEEKETEQIKEKKEEEDQKDIIRPKQINNIDNETNNKNSNNIIADDSTNNNSNNIQKDMNRNKGSNIYYNNYLLYTTTYSKNKFNDFNIPDLAYSNTFFANQENYIPKMSNFSNSSWLHGSSTNDTTTIFTRYSNSFSNKSNNNSFGPNNTFNEYNNSNNIINNNNFNNKNNNLNNNINSHNIINDNKNMNININNNNLQEKTFEPEVKIKKILSLEDKRASIMIKNIPNKFTRDLLLNTIDQNFKGTYDLFILPTDGSKNKNFGYSFINFISCYFIPYFYSQFNNKNWSGTNSKKICEITYSKIQGRQNLISYYSNKIIFYNKSLKEINDKTEYKIPIEYKNYFLELYPQQIEKISEKDNYFITNMPIENKV